MKTILSLLSVAAVLMFTACSKPDEQKEKNVIGVLNGELGEVQIEEGKQEKVLAALGATQKTDSTYEAIVSDPQGEERVLEFAVKMVADVSEYAAFLATLDSMVYPIKIVYDDARCGQVHPAFVSPCVGTFGKHRRLGASMIWSVNQWSSCANGDTICTETLKTVGNITYYPGPNCNDTLTITRPILRFRCD